jgi:hypothetical protein
MRALFGDAGRLVLRAPLVLAGLWALTAAASLPLTLSVNRDIATQLGASTVAASVAAGGNYDWMQEFAAQASGASTTLTPRIIGFAATLDNASGFVDRSARPLAVTMAALVYLAAMTFLAGGSLDRLARGRRTSAYAFFGACGGLFPRFLRLGLLSAIVYAALVGPYHDWIFETFVDRMTANMTAERNVFGLQLVGYAMWLLPMGLVNLLFDYAKVRAVVEDRRSALGSVGAALDFLKLEWRRASLFYLANLVLLGGVVGLYALLAPGIGGAGLGMWAGFVVSQLYIAARLAVKLLFWATEITFFQSRLAHAGYVRRQVPEWPDSPAAEAI